MIFILLQGQNFFSVQVIVLMALFDLARVL